MQSWSRLCASEQEHGVWRKGRGGGLWLGIGLGLLRDALNFSPSCWLLRLVIGIVVDIDHFQRTQEDAEWPARSRWGEGLPDGRTLQSRKRAVSWAKGAVRFKGWEEVRADLPGITANLEGLAVAIIQLGPWCMAIENDGPGLWSLSGLRDALHMQWWILPSSLMCPYI